MQLVHSSKPVVPRDRLIRLPEVEALLGVKKSTIYDMLKKGEFIRPIRFSARAVVWPETAVLQWIQDQIKQAETPPIARPASTQIGANFHDVSAVQS